MEEKKHIVSDKGVTDMVIWQCDDIRMGHTRSIYRGLTSFSAANPGDVVRMHFGLKGDYIFDYKQLGRSFDLIGGHHNIMWSQGFDMTVQNKTLEMETFGVQFPRDLFIRFTENASEPLKRFAGHILQGKAVLFADNWGAIDPAIQLVIQQVLHCRFSGELKKNFLLSKSVELLVLSAETCSLSMNKNGPFIKTRADKEKIIAVRDLINERVHHPPNLSEIARAVGLNEYKLKRGFKETFSSTVFGYLTEQRLHLAQRYLRDTQKTAAEISAELGYSTPQHFNNAFKKKFGVTPHSIRGRS